MFQDFNTFFINGLQLLTSDWEVWMWKYQQALPAVPDPEKWVLIGKIFSLERG